jgi:hypothetical protein
MTLKILDRAFETTLSTGTGAVNLQGAVSGYKSFAAAGNGSRVIYEINDGDTSGLVQNWEIGIGTITTGTPNILSRDLILSSSNNNSAVNFGSGTKNVLGTVAAATLALRDENLNFVEGNGTGAGSGNSHTVTLPISPLGYSDGMQIIYNAPGTNSTGVTLNVNGLGAKGIKINGANLPAGTIKSGALVIVVYRTASGYFELVTPVSIPVVPQGQCRISMTSNTLILKPFNGNQLTIGGVNYTIPAAGVTLAATGLAADTNTTWKYVYAYLSSGTMTLEAVQNTVATWDIDPATGMPVKKAVSGGALDTSRTLVGMVWCSGAATFGTGNGDVANWFNRRLTQISAFFTSDRTTTSTTATEINAEIRNNFLSWGEAAQVAYNGIARNSAANITILNYLALDTALFAGTGGQNTANGNVNASLASSIIPTEGRHYATIYGAVLSSSTGTWLGSSATPYNGILATSTWL